MDECKILHADRARQLISFEGMSFERNIRPTDIDGFIEIGNREYIVFEIKYRDAEMQQGQRTAIENLCNTLGQSKKCIGILASHNVHNPIENIIAKDCTVIEYLFNKVWWEGDGRTLYNLIRDWRLHTYKGFIPGDEPVYPQPGIAELEVKIMKKIDMHHEKVMSEIRKLQKAVNKKSNGHRDLPLIQPGGPWFGSQPQN